MVIPLVWGNAYGFKEGVALVRRDSAKASERRMGYIDKAGKLVLDCQWHSASNFSEGLASIQLSSSSKHGYIDKTGKLVIPAVWDKADRFSEGLATVQRDGQYGFINKTGQLIAPLQKVIDYRPFKQGYAKLWLLEDRVGLLDKSGKLFFPATKAE